MFGACSQSCPNCLWCGGGRQDRLGAAEMAGDRGHGSWPELPWLLPITPVLPLEHSGFLTQVQINLLFPWISLVRLGALTEHFPRKQLTARKT